MLDTIVALATPFGISAIAKIRVSGPKTRSIILRCFSRENPVSHLAFLANYRSTAGKIIDQVMALFFDRERSYTGEDALEIDCHGNPLIIRSILEDLQISECRIAEPGEFTKRAYLNHKIDLCQAEAVLDIIHAANENALEVSRKQLYGALSEKVFHLNDVLLSLLAEIEAQIDFMDEGLEFDEKFSERLALVLCEITEIMDGHQFRRILLNGISVAIVGCPNAGKSSLLNALLGEERAIVSDIPGTTRDSINESMMIDGFLVKIIDTAGLRDTDNQIEQFGVDRTIENIHLADLCLMVIDQNDPQFPKTEIVRIFQEKPCILVLNKSDLGKNPSFYLPEEWHNFPSVSIAAKHKVGMDALKTSMACEIRKSTFLPKDITIIINERHRDIFQKVCTLVCSAKDNFNHKKSCELCASDLRLALETLGYIMGKYDTEDMLGKIFSQFCVGK